MRHRKALLPVLILIWASTARAQELTTKTVLENMDKQAAAFTSLQATVTQTYTNYGVKQTELSGPLSMQSTKGEVRTLLDMTMPKDQAMRVLIEKGKLTAYMPNSNTYYERNASSDVLAYLLLGFGSPSSSFTMGYKPEYKGRETVNGVSTVRLELTSASATTKKYPKVTLWLDPKTWTSIQVRLYEVSANTFKDFAYSDVRLNKGVSKSAFDLRMKSSAKKQ